MYKDINTIRTLISIFRYINYVAYFLPLIDRHCMYGKVNL